MDLTIKEYDRYYELYEKSELVYKTQEQSFCFGTKTICVTDKDNTIYSKIICNSRIELYEQNINISIKAKNIFSTTYSFYYFDNEYTMIKKNKKLYELKRNGILIADFIYGFNEFYHHGFYNLSINEINEFENSLFYFNIFLVKIGRFYTD